MTTAKLLEQANKRMIVQNFAVQHEMMRNINLLNVLEHLYVTTTCEDTKNFIGQVLDAEYTVH